jgi:polyferredoxin
MSSIPPDNNYGKMTYKPIESPPSQVLTEQINDAPYPPVAAYDELTEEERVEYEKGILTWSKVKNWRFWIRKEWTWYYVLFVLLVVVVALMAFFHHSVSPLKIHVKIEKC